MWYVATRSTTKPEGEFRTKREATEYGRKLVAGTGGFFMVWKKKLHKYYQSNMEGVAQ